MHPDYSLVLQKCASSPRLCVQQTLTIAADYLIPPPPAMAATATFAECCKNAQPTKGDEFVRIDSDEDEDCDNLTTTTTTTVSTTNRRHPLFIGENEDDDEIVDEELDETKSMCSELSVGREVQTVDDLEGTTSKPPKDPGGRVSLLDMNDNQSNSSQDDDTNADTVRTSKSTQRNPFALASSLRFSVPFGFPTNPACPAISPFQEEFLRKSHLYAEELMKHQMQLMAAARASAFSLRSTQNPALAQSPLSVNSFSKIGQISAAAAAAAMASNLTVPPQQYNFQPQHYAAVPSDTLAKLSALSKQAPSTQVMSTLNQLQTQMQARLPSALLNNDHEQLHERALKFSIDNILKADFGRNHYNDLSECSRKSNNVSKIARSSKRNLTTNNHATNSNDITDALPSPTQTYSTSVSVASMCTNSNDSSSTVVSSSYGGGSSVDLVKLSPLQTPAVSPQSQAQPTIASAQPTTALLTSTSCNNSTESAKVTGNCASKSSLDDNKETCSSTSSTSGGSGPIVWPAWVYCTRYSDRPSSGPRVRKPKKTNNISQVSEKGQTPTATSEDKRPRTAFSGSQLARLKHEFNENRYLTEKRRQQLSSELGLNEAQIKIWFQNKRAKLKKSSGVKNPLALQLMAQGLYNHSTVPLTREEEELQEMQEREREAAAAAAVANSLTPTNANAVTS